MDRLIQVQQLKSRLDEYRPFDLDLERQIWDRFRLDWNYHSNKIEGNSLTYGETKALLLHNITAQGKPLKDHFEITGHNEAVKWVLDIVTGERSLTESFIRELHKLILKEPYKTSAITSSGAPTTKTVHVGKYKSTENHVLTRTGEIFRFASVGETPALMADLITWYLGKVAEDYNPVLLAAEFHYKFIRIHPFDDGNGRTVRILMNFILMKFGLPPVIIKENQKGDYLRTLELADADKIDPFIEFICDRLIDSQQFMLDAIKSGQLSDDNDIEKRFNLLDARIRKINETNEKSRNENDIYQFIESWIFNLQEGIEQSASAFKKYYNNYSVEMKCENGSRVFKTLEDLHKIYQTPFNVGFINDVAIVCHFKKKQSITNNYSTGLVIHFALEEISIFEGVQFDKDKLFNPISRISYGVEYDQKLATRIISRLTKNHLKHIDEKLPKA